ncbi:MAG: hypothetical protein HOJ06_01330 [Rhodospirillaceae bacterium]|nr:hypothetical protein [Rhodospirillaceae bacterium]
MALSVTLGVLFTPVTPTHADVRIWTDKENVILKGNLQGLKILPSGNAKATPPPKVKPKNKTTTKKQMRNKTRADAAGPQTLSVGPTRIYKTPSQAAQEARDHDTIEIDAGVYVDCAVWKASNITIRGVGGRAHVKDKMCQGKGIWVTKGRNIIIENIEFSGMRVPSENGAGIRHEGAGLIIRNSYFHDGEEGILGGGIKPNDVILIEDSEFARLGRKGQAHPMYINVAELFTLRRSYVHGCVDQANCVKSRAKRTIITCNVIASLDSNSSFEIDLPQGGHATVRDNIIEQGPKSVNYNIISFAVESKNPKRRNPEQNLIFKNNIVINDHRKGRYFLIQHHRNTKINVSGNRFIGPGTLDFKDGNEYFPRRFMAGLKPYPALPPGCKK